MISQRQAFLLLGVFLLLQVGFWVWSLPPNHDEGWILHAAGLVGDGLQPYEDFGFTQGRWLPTALSGSQSILGPGLLGGRVFSACAGLVAIGLVVDSVRILVGRSIALLILALTALDPFVLAQFCLVKSYGLATLGVALSLWIHVRTHRSSSRFLLLGEFVAAFVLTTTALGVRLSLVAVVMVWSVAAFRRGRVPGALAFLGVLLGAWVGVGGSVPSALWWNLVAVHLGPWFADGELQTRWMFGEWVSMLFHMAWVLVVWLGLWAWVARTARGPVKWSQTCSLPLGWMILAGTFAHLLPGGRHAEYVVVLWPCVALLAGLGAQHGARVRPLVWGCIGGLVIIHGAFCWIRLAPQPQASPPASLSREIGGLLQGELAPGQRILTFHPLVAVEARRRLVRGMEMGPFSLLQTSEWEERLRRMSPEQVVLAVGHPETGAVVVGDRDFLHDAYNRALDPELSARWREGVLTAAEGRFGVPVVFGNVGQFREEVRVYSTRDGAAP